MRKIIFRGRRIGGGEWVQGGIAPAYHTPDEPFGDDAEEGYRIIADGRAYVVDQDSIGQYTGKNDKNGTPIFEGDLVEAVDHLGNMMRGRVLFGTHAPTMQADHYTVGWWIQWMCNEFYRKELGFWRGKITVVGPWADNDRLWDQWCEEAAAYEQARKNL